MKISKVIALADELKPNALSHELKIHYINEVEGLVQTEIMRLSLADVISYDEGDLDRELLVNAPHDKLYVSYLVAMLDFANGEYNKYSSTLELFNQHYSEYHRFYFDRFHPADGGAEDNGYYISAYAIARKHGFEGTEEEWVETLGGTGVDLKSDGGIISWKPADGGDDEWQALIDVSSVTKDAEDAAINAATAAAQASEYAASASEERQAANAAKAAAESAKAAAESASGEAKTALDDAQAAAELASGYATSANTAQLAAEKAAEAAEKAADMLGGAIYGGVTSFNGRCGPVEPETGDYTADMVGAAPTEHTHDGYAEAEHTHEGYAEAEHTHEGYAPAEHGHEGYASAEHTHTILKSKTATLTANGWSDKKQTVAVDGVTTTNTVFVSPAPSFVSDYGASEIYCSAQVAGSLTFTCATTPTADITVNIVIMEVTV